MRNDLTFPVGLTTFRLNEVRHFSFPVLDLLHRHNPSITPSPTMGILTFPHSIPILVMFMRTSPLPPHKVLRGGFLRFISVTKARLSTPK
jgi:hypothetical protein